MRKPSLRILQGMEVQADDPLWYKDAIVYEVHVKSFYDSNGDGVGDFKGLIEKLDYIRDLGVTAIWLLPFYPSPLKDDGYDISDYFDVHSLYGTLRDFKRFVKEAHKRGIKVITELVLNHTSDQHPWFQRARRSPPGSRWRNYYVWSDTPDRYKGVRVIFKDFEKSNWSWDPVAKAYYWHRFYHHQPDLNYDNPEVYEQILKVVDFWLSMGVDGLRLDAVPYLYEREGTSCENLPETHEFLKKLRKHIDSKFPSRMLLGEVNQWPDDAVAYFGDGDECHCLFHFPLMPRMYLALKLEDSFPIIDIFERTPPIPENCQWFIFLRNHDELTLEMVTDEERDFLWKYYAKDPQMRINLGIRRRLAPLMDNDRRKIELMNVMLFTFPGTPVIYYGDEIGMGDNYALGDRNGVRTPMQWNSGPNAGFSIAPEDKLYLPVISEGPYSYRYVNVESQLKDPNSLLMWMRKIISVRKRFKAFGRGSMRFLETTNRSVLAYVRQYENEVILVVINLSSKLQLANLNLGEWIGKVPIELMSGEQFPKIEKEEYQLPLNPYGYYIFQLVDNPEPARSIPIGFEIRINGATGTVLIGEAKTILEKYAIPSYLRTKRWFLGKDKEIDTSKIRDYVVIGASGKSLQALIIIDVYYTKGVPETYFLPIKVFTSLDESSVVSKHKEAIIAKLKSPKGEGVIIDATYSPSFRRTILRLIASNKVLKGTLGTFEFRNIAGLDLSAYKTIKSRLLSAEQSNTSVLYKIGEKLVMLKLFRKLDEGTSPEFEMCVALREGGFSNAPAVLGAVEFKEPGAEPITLAILQEFIRNKGDAWKLFKQVSYNVLLKLKKVKPPEVSTSIPLPMYSPPNALIRHMPRRYLHLAELLGRRTGEMHRTIYELRGRPGFEVEEANYFYQLSLRYGLIGYAKRTIKELGEARSATGCADIYDLVKRLENKIIEVFGKLPINETEVVRIRVHGDYHLGQVLFTGTDFVIIDFEGEPLRPISERKLKRIALRDVAGMLRSFSYVAHSAVKEFQEEDREKLHVWAEHIYMTFSKYFLRGYLDVILGTKLIPSKNENLNILLKVFLLEKLLYELQYEARSRPEWLDIPARGLVRLIGEESHGH